MPFLQETRQAWPYSLRELTICDHLRPWSTLVPNLSRLGGAEYRRFLMQYFSHSIACCFNGSNAYPVSFTVTSHGEGDASLAW